MAILTVSSQFGSRGEEIARDVARRTGFRLVTRQAIEARIRVEYRVESPPAEALFTPRWPSKAVSEKGLLREEGASADRIENGDGNGETGARDVNGLGNDNAHAAATLTFYADLVAAVVADLAVAGNCVLVECGGQFLLREAPCAMHLRVVAPRPWRAATVAAELGLAPPAAAEMVAHHDAAQARYQRSVFGRSAHHSDLYHLVLNTAALDLDHAIELAMAAVEASGLRGVGSLPEEAAERLKVRSKMRLARRLADLPGSPLLERVPFAHPSERVFARLMGFYGIQWEYEPRTFPIHWNEKNEVVEAFTPDFYLPEMDLYVELTTMKQSLVTRKNRKVKRLRELHPDINIRVFYQKDVEDLIFKLGASRLAIAP